MRVWFKRKRKGEGESVGRWRRGDTIGMREGGMRNVRTRERRADGEGEAKSQINRERENERE